MNFLDKDILTCSCHSDGVTFQINQEEVIESQDDEGTSVLYLYEVEIEILLNVINQRQNESNSLEDSYQNYRLDSSNKSEVNGLRFYVFLSADLIKDKNVFISKDSLNKMLNTSKNYIEEKRKSREFDIAMRSFQANQELA